MILRIFDVFVGVFIFSVTRDVRAFDYDSKTNRELCVTQCTAVCFQNQTLCTSKCRRQFQNARWITNCDTEGCKGSCEFLQYNNSPKDDQDLPSIPDVMTFLAGTNVFVSWNPSSSQTPVLYVLQMKQNNDSWTTVMSKVTNTTYEVDIPDICAKYQFRVMAINMKGSNGFSMPATVPDIKPGPLSNVAYVGNGMYYYALTGDFAGIVQVDLPQGWNDSMLSFDFDDMPIFECPSLYNVPKLEFQSLLPRNLTTHLQHAVGVKIHGDAFGCIFHSRVRAVSRCGVKGMWTNVTVNLQDCYGIKSFPCSSIQIPFNPPGNVKNVTLRADLRFIQARLRINWSPPDDLGSTGFLDHYLMRWGKVKPPPSDDPIAQPQYIEDSETRLERTIIEFEVWVPKENDTSYGFQIVPLAPNQQFENNWGLFQLFTIPIKSQGHSQHHPNGTINNDEEVSIVHISNSLNISVMWTSATFNTNKRSFNDHYLIQYGEVDSTQSQSFRTNSTCTKVVSPVCGEIMATEHDIAYSVCVMEDLPVILSLNKSHTLYGLKILGYPLVAEDDVDMDKEWANETMYVFTIDEPMSTINDKNYKDSSDELLGLAVLTGVLAASILIVIVACRVHHYKRKKFSSLHQRILDNSEPMTNPYNLVQKKSTDVLSPRSFSPPVVPDAWEVPHSCVKVGRTLGKGAFGEVLKGRVSKSILQHRNVKVPLDTTCGLHVSVAVKMLKGIQVTGESG